MELTIEAKRYPKVSTRVFGMLLVAWLTLVQQSEPQRPGIQITPLPTTSTLGLAVENKALVLAHEFQEPIVSKAQYTIKPQDTLIDIATNFGTTVERIVKDNKIQNPDLIFAGQKLRVTYPREALELIQTSGLRNIKQLIQQQYYDLSFEGEYYRQGELNSVPNRQEGKAHLYGIDKKREALNIATSSGKPFEPNKSGCASWFYPLGTKLLITYKGPASEPLWPVERWKRVVCEVNDRGPHLLLPKVSSDVIVDLTRKTAESLEPKASTFGELKVEVVPLELPGWWGKITLPQELPEKMAN